MKLIKKIIFIFIFINIFSVSLFTEENIKNKIYKNLRCLVCQGQSISDSKFRFCSNN